MVDSVLVRSEPAVSPAVDLYLELLKRCLTREIFPDRQIRQAAPRRREAVRLAIQRRVRGSYLPFDPVRRSQGRDWPEQAETMIGRARLDNLQACVTDVIRRDVPGDVIETGVWRGGATILMKAVLQAHGDSRRTVWIADSFCGVPKPDPDQYPADAGDRTWTANDRVLAVSAEEVKANFVRYGLLDERVRFLVGWFRDTLPSAPIDSLAVLRLDGDLYESTMDALRALYPKVSPGGYVIVDDYGNYDSCRTAVTEYRAEHGITDPIQEIDGFGVFWQRSSSR